MSRVLQQDNEGKTASNIGPIRWMSPESLGQQVYSKKSDVWSFGIVGM
jgi:serine/threonine protein kinase